MPFLSKQLGFVHLMFKRSHGINLQNKDLRTLMKVQTLKCLLTFCKQKTGFGVIWTMVENLSSLTFNLIFKDRSRCSGVVCEIIDDP